ncbi:MAG TPA: hypothetical protein VHZ51_22850 [Ktedonobacteraceae bacterium]|jgi:hypothetical protein|nr:hypothetical protein [Ktedonobacteraceae bacterium]
MSESEQQSSDLVIVARDATGQVITRLTCTRSREVISAMKSARSVLRLKGGAVRVEVHRYEAPTSNYAGQPLAAMSLDDLEREQTR